MVFSATLSWQHMPDTDTVPPQQQASRCFAAAVTGVGAGKSPLAKGLGGRNRKGLSLGGSRVGKTKQRWRERLGVLCTRADTP